MRTAARIPTTSYRWGMATEDTHGLGYHRVDDDPNVDVLIATMDGTAGWDATLRLRSWERAHLGLAHGERLLDVGCGLGEAALVLAQDLGDGGELVGVDVSERMLRVARSNAGAARCRVRFTSTSIESPTLNRSPADDLRVQANAGFGSSTSFAPMRTRAPSPTKVTMAGTMSPARIG